MENSSAKTLPADKLYFSIGEVASHFGVTTSLIRFWETEFTHIKPKKNSKGDRRYTHKDILEIKTIYNLVKERGFTLQGAKDYLQGNHRDKKQEVVEVLKNVKSLLLEIRKSL